MKRIVCACIVSALWSIGCGNSEEMEQLRNDNKVLQEKMYSLSAQVDIYKKAQERLQFLAKKMEGLKARIKTSEGDIEVKFFTNEAPLHCFNFITRAECGFYDNTQFHRVIPGFMIQGGDPNSKDADPANDGMGGPIVAIPHEFNTIKHVRGILSMARTSDVSAGAGSQFFIMHGDSPQLDNQYTVFGEVISGLDIVDKIATTPTNKSNPRLRDHPIKPMVIKGIEIYR